MVSISYNSRSRLGLRHGVLLTILFNTLRGSEYPPSSIQPAKFKSVSHSHSSRLRRRAESFIPTHHNEQTLDGETVGIFVANPRGGELCPGETPSDSCEPQAITHILPDGNNREDFEPPLESIRIEQPRYENVVPDHALQGPGKKDDVVESGASASRSSALMNPIAHDSLSEATVQCSICWDAIGPEIPDASAVQHPATTGHENSVIPANLGAINERNDAISIHINNEDSREVRQLFCGHKFHKSCVDPWLRKEGTCPNCRAQIPGYGILCPRPKTYNAIIIQMTLVSMIITALIKLLIS